MKRFLIIGASAFVLAAGSAAAMPSWFDNVCACGGTKLSLGGFPVGGGWWQCQFIVNGQTVVTEYHTGGCP